MLENIKLFATDNDRSTYEEGDNYAEPYISLVDGVDNVNYDKLIIGTINNPSIGTVNVKNGDYFDRISLQKSISIGKNRGNFLCFPFDITINELREALGNYKLHYVYFASDLTCGLKVDAQGHITQASWNNESISDYNYLEKNGNLIIPSGKMLYVMINQKEEFLKISMTLTFKNKTIVINDHLISENIPQSNWYFVGTPFKSKSTVTGLSTAPDVILISNGLLSRDSSYLNIQTCSGWIEYRGPVPSE